VNVAGRQPGGKSWEVFGSILNPEFFHLELANPAKALAVPRPF
jgi:hypothetical protein